MSADQIRTVPDAPGAGLATAPPGIIYCGIGDEAGTALADQVRAITALGWPAIELRNVDGVALADLDSAAFTRLRSTLDEANLTVSCVDSRIANWGRPVTAPLADDLRELEVLGRRCPELGTRYVRVMSYPNDGLAEDEWGREVLIRMRTLVARAEDLGLVLLHENCAGWAGRCPTRMHRLMETVDSPALRLLFDMGNGIAYDYDAYDLLGEIVEHVAHVHVKDGTGDVSAQEYTLPGEGQCRVADCLRLLLAHGYTGTWSIEPHVLLRPHDNLDQTAERDGVAAFVAYGRRLEQLVRDEVLAAPGRQP
ncbi:MAG TPA: sugar phosphate isomerase/epimerase family protein [Micromonospora sp.]|nr:sugar phosphate isomerase/epimerase family protein [Micromonospora sp.]